jgi:hypothetical protein
VFYLIVTAEDNNMLSINNNDYDYTERERKVIELYKEGKRPEDVFKRY